MRVYEKPMILANEELAEGVYAASGDVASGDGITNNSVKCDSQYMNGTWQGANYGGDGTQGYKYVYGCQGCPATREGCCGIGPGGDYEQSGYASSYNSNIGKYKPAWEWNGYKPYDPVTGSGWTGCGNQAGEDRS